MAQLPILQAFNHFIAGATNAATTNTSQQIMMSVLLNLQAQQQEQHKRNDDINEKNYARLEQNDRKKVTWESMLAG